MTERNQQSSLLGKIAAYTEILVKDPGSTIFVSLAETYRKMGMFDDARQIISKGLEMHEDFSPAYIVLARLLCQQEDFSGSVSAFERALELDDNSLAGLVGYARVKILLGQEAEARELLLRARELSPADPVINKLLLSLPDPLATEEDQPVVKHESVDELSVSTPSLMSQTLADLYLKQGLTQKALDIFRQLSAQNPDDLALRRKIKELESDQVVLDSPQQEHEKDEVSLIHHEDGTSISEVDNDEQDSCVAELSVPNGTISENIVSDSGNRSMNEPVLDILNQWLSNIQQRRGDV